MTFFEIQKSTAILLFSAVLSAVPSLAQANAPTAKSATELAPVNGKVVEDIVARVNDQIVTQSDYDRAAEQLDNEARQQAVPPRELEQKKADLLRDLIDQQLLLSKGKELGITGETELIKRLDEIRKQNHLESMDDLEKAYASQGQGGTFEDFKASIRNGIVTQQVVRDEVGRHITMSPGDVQRYFQAHESQFAQPESVTLNEILIPTGKAGAESSDPAEVAAAQKKAEDLVAKLAAGAKFEDLAKANSSGSTAAQGGALGEFRRGMLAKELEDKTFALSAGQYTQPIRTKQGFIILQVAQHNTGGAGSFKQVEPQVEEALFLERMQPALRTYLTKLREEAYVEIKPGVVDTGASGNEMRLTYSAYTPPAAKKKAKFARTRFRGRDRSMHAKTAAATAAAPAPPTPATPATATASAVPAAPAAPAAPVAPTQQASNTQGVEKPGKREKIRFGQAPRESLPASQVATAVVPDNAPTVTAPETRIVNPDGTISGEGPAVSERKTRLSSRPVVHKAKKDKSADTTPPPATPEELAAQKVQASPLGLAPQPDKTKKTQQKGDKTRYSAKPKEPDQTPAPYLGKPETSQPSSATRPAPPSSQQPAPATAPPDPIPPGAQQP
jgi:peptidyl-prolyl cis-trans isomerase SurA